MKVKINNEEVLCDKNITINEEMLNTSSVILNNVYPKTWEEDKDYVSRFYYPKDYSKCKIYDEIEHPATREDVEGTNFSINVDTTKQYEIQTLKGQTTQSGTPTPSSPQPINITTGRQVVSVCGKNILKLIRDNETGGSYDSETDTYSSTTRLGTAVWYFKTLATSHSYTFSTQSTTNAEYLYCFSNNDLSAGSDIVSLTYGSGGNITNGNRTVYNNSNLKYLYVTFRTIGSSVEGKLVKPMLEVGETPSTYEEYKGNDYEINLGKNLFSDTLRQGVTTYNTGQWSNSNSRITSTDWITLKAGTYTISADTTITGNRYLQISCVTFDTRGNFYNISGVSGQWKRLPFTFTTPVDLNWKCNISFNDSYSLTPSDVYDIQLEKGNIVSGFTPYKTPIYLGKIGNYKDYIIKTSGKNLFDESNIGSFSNTSKYYDFTTPLEAGTYTFSCINTASKRIRIFKGATYDENNYTDVINWNANTSATFTTTDYINRIQVNSGSAITITDWQIMLNEGSQATLYEPYGTGQWYIHKEIGRVVLNGSETWEYQYSNGWRTNITNLKQTTDLNQASYLLSNYYKSDTQNAVAGSSYGICNRINNSQMILKNVDISNVSGLTTWLSSHNVEVYYVLNTPTNTLIEDEELINQLNSIELLEGLNNVSVSSADLPFIMSLMYNYQEAYTEEDLYFSGVVENTGNISLNPRYPHYCNLQVLDFKTFLSEGETLDFVIYNKTVLEAINQVIGTISDYGFVLGNVNILHGDDVIGAYSTKDKTAYDVFNYLADITQSRWTTRMIDENTVAIDFYDPTLMPQGTSIEYTQNWFINNKIQDMNFSYSSRDYRNKQVMLSGEVYANIETTEIIVADGYQTQFNTTDKIGYVSSMLVNGSPVQVITKEEYDLGYEGDFIYQPGNPYFESVDLVSTGAIITIVYYAIIQGREIILNQEEISRVGEMINRKGVIARYENRNDATTTGELQAIGQSYLKYKGNPEVILKVDSLENIWNVGERVEFNSPLEELSTEYMVKKKTIQYIPTQDNVFYTYELSSSFNSETEINYFDNQRSKMMGNIGVGEVVSRNIDIENTANVIFYDLEVEQIEVEGNSTLQSKLQSVLGGVE